MMTLRETLKRLSGPDGVTYQVREEADGKGYMVSACLTYFAAHRVAPAGGEREDDWSGASASTKLALLEGLRRGLIRALDGEIHRIRTEHTPPPPCSCELGFGTPGDARETDKEHVIHGPHCERVR